MRWYSEGGYSVVGSPGELFTPLYFTFAKLTGTNEICEWPHSLPFLQTLQIATPPTPCFLMAKFQGWPRPLLVLKINT